MTITQLVRPMRLIGLRFASEIRYLTLRFRAMRMRLAVPRGYYLHLDGNALQKNCRGDTLFILGSGASLATLPDELQEEMRLNTTMSLNFTILQTFIPADFHVIRELGVANDIVVDIKASGLERFGRLVSDNPCYKKTVFIVQGGYYGWAANLLIGCLYLPRGVRLFTYRNSLWPGFRCLGSSFDSVTHGASTITDCINLGYLMGFQKIVLCGVDLYDRRYFWHVSGSSFIPLSGVTDAQIGEYGGSGDLAARHRAAERLVMQAAHWRKELKGFGVELFVQNPRSLLTEVLPTYLPGASACKRHFPDAPTSKMSDQKSQWH